MLEALKVVSAEEMVRLEQGGDLESYVAQAGQKVAERAKELLRQKKGAKTITLLVGRGNNGADGYAAGICLLEEGFQVHAFSLDGKCSLLNQKFRKRFQKKEGRFQKSFEGLILDGLLGTGFKGKMEPEIARLIQKANQSECPILSIDLPSGLNPTTGQVEDVAIVASETVALGFAKIGCFLRQGWNHVGRLYVADFGLNRDRAAQAQALAYLPLHLKLPPIVRNRHKYQAGYVIGFGGSKALPGAVKLAGLAALRAGAGIVRIFHSEPIGQSADELICVRWNQKLWKEALGKAGAVFIGPGLGQSPKQKAWLKSHLKQIRGPCVIDADALLPDLPFPEGAILTPHRGEMLRLLEIKTAFPEEELFAKVIRFCERKKVIVVLKGAPTWIFAPDSKPIIIPRGDPGMATAGAGDVLTGMISALLAQGSSSREAAILGSVLHAIAGEEAAREKTSYCLTASDLIEFMPAAFRALMKGHDIV